MSLILFSARSMKLKEPLPRILVRGSYDFFAVSFWHIKTKKFKPERYKSFGNGARLWWSGKFFLAMVRGQTEFGLSLVSLIPAVDIFVLTNLDQLLLMLQTVFTFLDTLCY
jgi:hypothetical protein